MRSDHAQALEAEIARIRALGLDELRTLWRSTFRSLPPPPLTKDLMARFICGHIQEQALGGPDQNNIRLLDGLVLGGKPRADAHQASQAWHCPAAREYQGEQHTVTVIGDGYVWRDATYASLSTIARAITGTAWSGPRFFGVRAVPARDRRT